MQQLCCCFIISLCHSTSVSQDGCVRVCVRMCVCICMHVCVRVCGPIDLNTVHVNLLNYGHAINDSLSC